MYVDEVFAICNYRLAMNVVNLGTGVNITVVKLRGGRRDRNVVSEVENGKIGVEALTTCLPSKP
jgi:hypothetical protein